MDVPDTLTEEWIERAISGLTDEALIDVVATLRARGGRQAELVDRVLELRGKHVPAVGKQALAPLGATVIDDTVLDAERRVEEPVVDVGRPRRESPGWGGDLASGARFAGYVIEGVAGRGGMGVVYRAGQLRPSRIVALKVISPELADDSGFRERFTHESEIAASIEHSHVIPVYEVGEESHRLFIVMRYVEGTDLGRVIAAEGRVTPRRAVQILAQLTSALDAAHAHGLVHRDVKPANVLIARESSADHVYLTDFGLAKFAVSGGLTRTGMFVGTIDYAAPEQFEGRRVDARTDVYAAGCVLYNMLTGSVPFPCESEAAIMWAHLSASPPSVRDAVPTLPDEFDAVVARAMAKDPDDRYPSAGDLGRDAVAAADRQRATVRQGSVATGRAAPTPGSLPSASTTPEGPRQPGDAAARAQARAGSPGGRQPTVLPARARPRARIAVIAAGTLIAIAIVLLAVSGAFSSSSHRSPNASNSRLDKPKPLPAPTTKTFADSKLGLSFAYPASWIPHTLTGIPAADFEVADFGTGTGAAVTECALVILRGGAPASSSQQAQIAYVRAQAANEASRAKHYKVLDIQAEQGVNIAGVGLLSIDDALGDHLAFFFRGRDIYFFACTTPPAELTQVDQQAFRPLIASFRLG